MIAGESCVAKKYYHVSPLFVVGEISEKLVNHWYVDHLDALGLLSNFQCVPGLRIVQQIVLQL